MENTRANRGQNNPNSLANLDKGQVYRWESGKSGNPKGRPKGVRNWSNTMREFFELLQTNPKRLEKLTGIKLPDAMKKKDGQMILIVDQYNRALKGDGGAVRNIMERMDGKADQKIQIESNSLVDLIKTGHEVAKAAKAEAEDKTS